MYYNQPQNFWEGLFGSLATGIQKNIDERKQGEMWQGLLSAPDKFDISKMPQQQAINDTQKAIDWMNTNQDFKNVNTPEEQAQMKNDILNEASGNMKNVGLNWQPYQQPDTAGYKAAVQQAYDTPNLDNQGLFSKLGALAQQYGNVPTLKNDLQYIVNSRLGNQTGPQGNFPGLVEQGNIDLSKRPQVKNADGSISTVRSMGVNIDGKEVLIPTVSDDGRIMSDREAVDTYMRTGKHLGIFDSPEASDKYAQALHEAQDGYYTGNNSAANKQVDSMMQGVDTSPKMNALPSVSLQDKISYYKSQVPAAMKELIGKYGAGNAKEIYQFLQQTVNDKISEATNNHNTELQNQAYQILGSNADYKTKMVAGIKAGMKPALLKMALDNGLKFSFHNAGDRIIPVAVDEHRGAIYDMTTGQPITADSMKVGMSPYQSANLDLKAQDMANKASGAYYHGGGRNGGNGKSNGKINGMTDLQMDNEISKFKQWRAKNPDADEEEYPRYNQYVKAADPYGNYSQADQVVDSIDAESGDPENTFNYLYSRLGYGQGG